MAAEADLPEETRLLYDSGKHLEDFFAYYGSSDVERLSLKQWKKSGRREPAPYFITTPESIRKNRVEGEVVVEAQLEGKDDADEDGDVWVIFRPAPKN